ncbi:MAG: TIGR00266 family protein [Desulfobulbaceae bacterium DB1]|nr:MAG: TIGR00266 family protein [Desulfobulbaceae bacterium DB1]
MSAWFVAVDGKSRGPFAPEQIIEGLQAGLYTPQTLIWKEGYEKWQPLSDVPEFRPGSRNRQQIPTPPMENLQQMQQAHEIDFEIFGHEMQFVEIELDQYESAVAEAGSMMFMEDGIEMQTVFGDGSESGSAGLMEKFLGAGKRLITGESLFCTVFTNHNPAKRKVAFASPYPGKIIPLDLRRYNGRIICQKSSFLCAAKGVSIGLYFQKKIGVALFGGEGFVMQKLEGNGLCFVHAGGTIIEKELQHGESLRVDTGCLVAMTSSIDFDLQTVGGIKSSIFGGEGFFFARLQGPGHVWLQSLPFSRLAGKIHESAPQTGSRSQGEGSALGGLGKLFQD